MSRKISILVHLLIPLFALHLLEEVKTGFYATDPSTQYFSQYLHLDPQSTFYLLQLVLFLFLGILLVIILRKKKLPVLLTLILGIISFFELTHTYMALTSGAYVPGSITGTIIGILGLFIFYALS